MDGRSNCRVSRHGGSLKKKETLQQTLPDRLLTGRTTIFILFVIVSGLGVFGIFRLDITTSLEDYFLEDDPAMVSQIEFEELFQNRDFVGVLVESDDVFSAESLELIFRIGTILTEKLPGAGTLSSIAALDTALTGGSSLTFEEFQLVTGADERETYRRHASASPFLNGNLFTADYKEAWILISLVEDGIARDPFIIGEMAWKALDGIALRNHQITLSGVPIIAYRRQAELMEDLVLVLIIAAVAAVVISALVMRSLQGVLGALAVFGGANAVSMGIQGWASISVDSGFMGVPILLTMGVSIGYSVHVHRFFHMDMSIHGGRRQAAARALSETFRPILFTAVTTIAALLSFLFVAIRPIRWVGYASAISVFTSFVLSVTLFPAILTIGKDQEPRETISQPHFFKPMRKIAIRLIEERQTSVIFGFVVIATVALVGSLRLNVDFDAIEMMGPKLPHMQDQIRVGESEIAVGEYLNLIVSLPEGDFFDAEDILRIVGMEKELEGIPGVERSASISTILREVNSLFHDRSPEYAGIPDKTMAVEVLLRLMNSVMPEQKLEWIDESGRHSRIFIEITDFSSKRIEGIIRQIKQTARSTFPKGSTVSVSGSSYQMAIMNQYITNGLLRSIGTALATIAIIMILVFRSLRWGLVALIPNIFPVLVAGGILGFADIPLEFVTMTVAPIILGLAVDDTIHFMTYLKKSFEETGDFSQSLRFSFASVGAAITETTMILCTAFVLFTLSRVNSIRNMGIVAAAGMASAYLADLLVVPILVRLFSSSKSDAKFVSDVPDTETP